MPNQKKFYCPSCECYSQNSKSPKQQLGEGKKNKNNNPPNFSSLQTGYHMYSGERSLTCGPGRAVAAASALSVPRAVTRAGAPQLGHDGRWAGDAAGARARPGARPRDGRGAELGRGSSRSRALGAGPPRAGPRREEGALGRAGGGGGGDGGGGGGGGAPRSPLIL
jgi:hypothetical protein